MSGAAATGSSASFGLVSLAAPAYNEAAGLAGWLREWCDALGGWPCASGFEIVVCNDGSRDATREILTQAALADPRVRPVHHPENRGAGRAMATAIAATRGDWVLTVDSDGQFPPSCLAAFEEHQEPGARAYLGARRTKRDSLLARQGARATTWAFNLAHSTSYHDASSACQLVEGPLLRGLTLEARGPNYPIDILAKLLEAETRPVEVVIEHLPRATGQSSLAFGRSALERAGFMAYLGLRRVLVGSGVIAARGD
jgi:glycosyltransferase involved in cell wall biosynthesis